MRPILSPNPLTRKYRLLKEWTFTTRGVEFKIPKGYEYDGASVPRFFWRVISPFDPRVMVAALEHDYLCDNTPNTCKSHQAAKRFRDMLTYLNPILREAMYRAVLYFGPKW